MSVISLVSLHSYQLELITVKAQLVIDLDIDMVNGLFVNNAG